MERKVETVRRPLPQMPKPLRVAAYARVSSGKDEMLHSLSAQTGYYSGLIQSRPGWSYAGVYSDEAKTGTKGEREGFQRLLADCRAGLIDLVLVKSVSRFARNTVTLLETVRELKSLGVDVYFEEQNIHTLSSEGEFMLTIMTGIAQEESLSVSENQKWRVIRNFESGRPWNCTMLGYRVRDGVLTVVPEEAAVVRRIFSLYISGLGLPAIAEQLNSEGAETRLGGDFTKSGLHKILRNEAYTGNLLLQKTYRKDHLSKRTLKNDGERAKFLAEHTHEPIIDAATFEETQRIIAERREKYAPPQRGRNPRYPFSSLITCSKCGKRYRRKTTAAGPVWICPTFNDAGKGECPSKQIPEAALMKLTEGMDLASVEGVTAIDGNLLEFRFRNGDTALLRWEDRSRAASWTEEMKEKARQRRMAACRRER